MPQIQLQITMDEHGNCAVTGPVDNQMACYAMLEMARDAIKDHHAAKKSSGIITAPADAMSLVRKH